MGNYVTIKGTLLDPVGISDKQFPTTEIRITSSQFGYFNQVPIIRTINLVNSGDYEFKLLKGCNYTVTITSKPQAGTSGIRHSTTFQLEIPELAEDDSEYDLYHFSVTNFTPLLQQNEVRYAKFLENNNSHLLFIEDNKFLLKDLTYNRQSTINFMYPKGGLLNNNSFEYDLLDEDYTFLPLVLSNGADVNVSYNGDTPYNVAYNDENYYIKENTRSINLEYVNGGNAPEDIILKQKLRPNIIVPDQLYRLKAYFKLVSGNINGDIQINVENTNGTLITFDNVQLDETNNGWNEYDCLTKSIDDEYLINSSQNTFFIIKLGGISQNAVIRIDELQLQENYYNV